MRRFYKFARRMSMLDGTEFNPTFCLASNTLCRQFLTKIANQRRGFTRPRKARMALSRERTKRKLPPLSMDHAISKLVNAVEEENPSTVKQSADLDVEQVAGVSKAWKYHRDWWYHQMATTINIDFLCLLRMLRENAARVSGIER